MRSNAAVKVLIDVARTLAKQSIAFRGSDRDDDGNFLQIARLVARHNKNFQLWLDDAKMCPYPTTYLSPSSQNEFIQLLSEEVREKRGKGDPGGPNWSKYANSTLTLWISIRNNFKTSNRTSTLRVTIWNKLG